MLKKTTYYRIFFSLILLICGFAIYVLWRPNDLLFGIFSGISQRFDNNLNPVSLIKYTLPDLLWYAALLMLQPPLKFGKKWHSEDIITILAASLPFIHETGQWLGIFSGTFDKMDFCGYLVTLIIFLILWQIKIKES